MIATALISFIGLLIGSFLNVIIYRLPQKVSIISPPSACGSCKERISSLDNIPIFSWLLLRGKCRNCRAPISKRYPFVEAGTALFFASVGWEFLHLNQSGNAPFRSYFSQAFLLLAFLFLAGVSIALAAIDLDTQTLPNSLLLPSYGIGFLLLGLTGMSSGNWGAVVRTLLGALLLWLLYFAIAIAYPGGMGFGDVKLAGLLGLFLGYLGWDSLMVGGFAAFILGGIFSLTLLISGRAQRGSGIPFGPWMLAGAWVGIFFGSEITRGYLSLFGLTQTVLPN